MGAAVDPAVARARAVVGLYGDAAASGSIALDVRFTGRRDFGRLSSACAQLAAEHPHLGPVAMPEAVAAAAATATLGELLDEPYGDRGALLRVVTVAPGDRLLLAAHQGCVDGLGLLAVLAALLDEPVTSGARGIGASAEGRGFARTAVARAAEALLAPPLRMTDDREPTGPDAASPGPRAAPARRRTGDVIAATEQAALAVDTAAVVSAAARACAGRNAAQHRRSAPVVAAVGVSRRAGDVAVPDRQAAYVRLRLASSLDQSTVRRLLRSARPEPSFPERSVGRVATAVLGALRRRLGSTLLVSNLGLVAGPADLRSIAFYPAVAGRGSVAVGLASTASYTTVTVRGPRADFSAAAVRALSAEIARLLAAAPLEGSDS